MATYSDWDQRQLDIASGAELDRTCKIVRWYTKGPATKVVKRGVSHDQALKHCLNPETCSMTGRKDRAKAHTRQHGHWFDGWDWE